MVGIGPLHGVVVHLVAACLFDCSGYGVDECQGDRSVEVDIYTHQRLEPLVFDEDELAAVVGHLYQGGLIDVDRPGGESIVDILVVGAANLPNHDIVPPVLLEVVSQLSGDGDEARYLRVLFEPGVEEFSELEGSRASRVQSSCKVVRLW